MEIIDQETRECIEHDLDNTYLVEAGAGTGKTTLLVSRILEIIRLGKAELAKIVAITFTEKAAEELKLRIRRQLEKQIAVEQDNEIRKRFQDAFFGLERACITTIHGFCANILRDCPVEAKVDPSFDVADESMTNMLYRRAWKQWLWTQIQERRPELRELLRAGANLSDIAAIAQSLSQYRDCFFEFSKIQPITVPIAELRENMRLDIARLSALAAKCKNRFDRGYQRIARIKQHWLFWKILSDKAFQRRMAYGFPVRPEGNQKNWDQANTLREVKSLLKSLQQQSKNAQADVLHNLTQCLVKWLLDFLIFYQREKAVKALLDFDDLLICTRNMLKNDMQARSRIQENYAYLLVDEFQDTDPLQVEILFFLAESGPPASRWQDVHLQPGKLFMVGDPKQSIYRFRRADIEIYEEVKRKLGGCLNIVQNFRSRPEIIDWINLVFSRLIRPPIDGAYQPEYAPLHAFRDPSPKKPVVFLNTANLNKPRIEEIVRQEAYAIAWAIDKMVNRWPVEEKSRPLRYSDIAILARRFSYMEFFEKALQKFEIPYQVVGNKSYYSCLEVKSFLSLLRSLLNPCNTLSLVATLRSPIFAVSDEEILYRRHCESLDYRENGERETHIGKVLALLGELHEKIDAFPLPLLLEEILAHTGMVLTFLEMSQGEQRVANIMKFLEMSHALPRVGVCDFRGFVHWLDELERNEQEESQSYIHEQNSDCVHIFSIHRSKGLEFPVIFLGDLAAPPPRPSDILFDRTNRAAAVRMKGSLRLQTKNYPMQAQEEKKKVDAEEKRLLYVAMTRAKDYLVLPLSARKRGYMKHIENFLPSLPEKDYPYTVLNVPADLENSDSPYNPEDDRQVCKKDQGITKIDGRRKERSEILEFASKTLPGISLNKEREGKTDRVVRKVLAHLDPLAGQDMFLPGEMELLLGKESAAMLLSKNETDQARRMLLGAISSPLLLRAEKSRKLYRQLPFALYICQVLLEGSIDLCFLEKGTFTIVTYDTRAESPSEIDEIFQVLRALVLEELSHRRVREMAVFFLKTNAVHMRIVTRELLEKGKNWLRKATETRPQSE